MSKLKSFDDFVNENLVAKGEYNFYGPGSLMPLVQKLVSEGKGESVIRTYLYSIGVAPWRIEKVFNEMNVPSISLEKKVNEGKKMTFEEKATKFLNDINEDEVDEKQGYNDKEDESIAARTGAVDTKDFGSDDKAEALKADRDESYGKYGKRQEEHPDQHIDKAEESVTEASRWKGKEIFPKWVKPSDIKGYVKSINDLVDGQDYVFYEPGMDSWQAEYEYVGRQQGEYVFKSSAQFSTSPEERFSGKELAAMIKDLELAVMEGKEVNEGKKMKPFKKVKVGDTAKDYNGDEYKVIAIGKVKDLMKYDDSGAAEELDPNEDAIALDGSGGTAVFSYDPDGAAVYEAKKKTFEDAAAAFLLGLQGSDAVNDDKEAKVEEKLNKNTLQVKSKMLLRN